MSTRPDYRAGKVAGMARDAAEFISGLMKANRGSLPSCLNCAYAQEGEVAPGDVRLWCTGHKVFPPPRVIVYACDQYADNELIPF